MSWAVPLLIVSMLTPNPGLTALSVAALAAIALLLWRTGDPPILFFVCTFQWLQSSLKVFHADTLGVELYRLADSRSIDEALQYSVCWTVAIAAGMRVALSFGAHDARTVASIGPIDFRKLLTLYVVWTAVQPVLDFAVGGGLRQISVALSMLRCGVLFGVLLEGMRNRRHLGTAALVFAFELGTGFLSFFSSFKTPIFVLALALPAGNVRLTTRHIVGGALMMALALYLAVIWSAIKIDYRDRVSNFTGQQVVAVSKSQQIAELISLAATVDEKVLQNGWDRLLNRIAYIDYFASTIDFVPTVRAHEEGRLWAAALQHVFMPRLLFPDKPALESDTAVTERYTGIGLIATASRSSSISIGSPGESYVDFSWPGMLGPAFAVGMLYALLWRFARRGGARLIDVGMSVALLLPFISVELSNPKLLGGALTSAIVLTGIRPLIHAYFGAGQARALDSTAGGELPKTG